MTLIYACIAPHAADLIPNTAEDQNRVTRTRRAMEELGRHLDALQPEVVVIVNPHGFRVQTAISVAIAERGTVDVCRVHLQLKSLRFLRNQGKS